MKDQCKNDSAAVCTSSIGRSYQKPNSKLGLPGIRRNYPPARLSWSPSSRCLSHATASISLLSPNQLSHGWSEERGPDPFVDLGLFLVRLGFCVSFMMLSMRWWRWWRIVIRSLWPILPRCRSVWRRRRSSESMVCQIICWFSSDLNGWCAYIGK